MIKGNRHLVGQIGSIKIFFQVYYHGIVTFQGELTEVSKISPEDLLVLAKEKLENPEIQDEPKATLRRLVAEEEKKTPVVLSCWTRKRPIWKAHSPKGKRKPIKQ